MDHQAEGGRRLRPRPGATDTTCRIPLKPQHHPSVYAIPLFENDGSGIADFVRLAEADLEEIQFTALLDEQRPAAIFRLDALRATLGGAGDG